MRRTFEFKKTGWGPTQGQSKQKLVCNRIYESVWYYVFFFQKLIFFKRIFFFRNKINNFFSQNINFLNIFLEITF